MGNYLEWTDEERELHIKQFEDDVDKYLFEYKLTGEYPNLYISHVVDNEVVTESIDNLIKIKLSEERLEKLKKLKDISNG